MKTLSVSEYEQKLIAIIDGWEVKTGSQLAREVGIDEGKLHSWVQRMRESDIPLPKKSAHGGLTTAIYGLKSNPAVRAKIAEWQNK